MLNLPNLITLLRLLLVPVFVWLIGQRNYSLALAVFLIAGLSDALDGHLARRLDQVTRIGAALDPLADKLILLSALIALTWLEHMPLWLAFSLLLRDLVVVGGALSYRLLAGRLDVKPTYLGKLHTFLGFVLICVVMADAGGVVEAGGWLPALFLLLLASTVVSGAQYVWVWGGKARQLVLSRRPPG